MKVFRNMIAAIIVGVLGGILVSSISYYFDHKEGGMKQTLNAITHSFETISKMYARDPYENDIQADGNQEISNSKNASNVLETFDASITSYDYSNSELLVDPRNKDVLAMEGNQGRLEEGYPYSGIIRYHVRANSDSKEDQALKMAVKEDVLVMLNEGLKACTDVKECRKFIVNNLQNIYTTARNTIVEQGYDYRVKVYLTVEEFPIKTYGDVTFPAGKYQALRIDIGDAKGKNWWCVMYPPLCFIDESTCVVSEDGKKKLKDSLTLQEYKNLFSESENEDENKVTIKGKSWFYQLIKNKE